MVRRRGEGGMLGGWEVKGEVEGKLGEGKRGRLRAILAGREMFRKVTKGTRW